MTKYSYFGSNITGEYLTLLPHFTTFATFRAKMRNHRNQKFKTLYDQKVFLNYRLMLHTSGFVNISKYTRYCKFFAFLDLVTPDDLA